jgi:predicted nucleic acid-binding protein
MVLTAARRGRCERLLTEDLMHGQILDGVTIVNPFTELS